jgi:hypothetical protein
MTLFLFGIEHEVALLRPNGEFADFRTTPFADFAAIIDQLPCYAEDYPQLRIGSTGVRRKRWYVEGFDRYDDEGRVTGCLPKGIEIRTTPQPTIRGALAELCASFQLLRTVAVSNGFTPVLTSFHPSLSEVVPLVPFNMYEEAQLRRSAGDRSALFALLTYGPDLNISCSALAPAQLIDIGAKYIYYSKYIVPFTYSAPFFEEALWSGFSVRTFLRAGKRPAANVFLAASADELAAYPPFVKKARQPAEAGRIEFKACDCCGDFRLYAALLALLKGLLLDTTLPGRATTPDVMHLQRSARRCFADRECVEGMQMVVQAAEHALGDDEDAILLESLQMILRRRETLAHFMIQQFQAGCSILDSIGTAYSLNKIL